MAVLLYRVDERLIHGQVTVAWGHALRFDTIVVVDDELAASEWEQDLFRLAAGESKVHFATVDEAISDLPGRDDSDRRVIALTRDVRSMRDLVLGSRSPDGQGRVLEVNLGGLHHGRERSEVLPYLHLTEDDRSDIRALVDRGVSVSARDLPDAPRVGAGQLLAS